jgi:hypothetical protein
MIQKTCLSNNIYLVVRYNDLQNAMDNFTRDATQVNCFKIIGLSVSGIKREHGPTLKTYFPYARIC